MKAGEALNQARQRLAPLSETAAQDSQVLLADVLGCQRGWLLAHPEADLDAGQVEAYLEKVSRLMQGEPLPYVLGWWEFYGRRFYVNASTMIPRPETELLVELGMDLLRTYPRKRRGLDVGTGSGCIAVSLLASFQDLRFLATDYSFDALQVAARSAKVYGVEDRIEFLQMDLINGLQGAFDLICGNLPYIPTETLKGLDVGKHEPWGALDGGETGLASIKRLLERLPRILAPGGRALLEIGASQGGEALKIAKQCIPDGQVRIAKDLASRDRVLQVDRSDG
jgi:release factor glutamine methyltransferase